MYKTLLIAFLLLMNVARSQDSYENQACVTNEEFRLYRLVNQYRIEKGLPAIHLSASLCYVAGAHVWDLQTNQADQGKCNMHSWSEYGPWSECCYSEDHEKAQCVWLKPEELTIYDDFGYEVAYFSPWPVGEHKGMAEAALEGWKGSPGHDQMIINKYAWKRMKWNAMGVGIYGNYAVVWFGEMRDPAGKTERCP